MWKCDSQGLPEVWLRPLRRSRRGKAPKGVGSEEDALDKREKACWSQALCASVPERHFAVFEKNTWFKWRYGTHQPSGMPVMPEFMHVHQALNTLLKETVDKFSCDLDEGSILVTTTEVSAPGFFGWGLLPKVNGGEELLFYGWIRRFGTPKPSPPAPSNPPPRHLPPLSRSHADEDAVNRFEAPNLKSALDNIATAFTLSDLGKAWDMVRREDCLRFTLRNSPVNHRLLALFKLTSNLRLTRTMFFGEREVSPSILEEVSTGGNTVDSILLFLTNMRDDWHWCSGVASPHKLISVIDDLGEHAFESKRQGDRNNGGPQAIVATLCLENESWDVPVCVEETSISDPQCKLIFRNRRSKRCKSCRQCGKVLSKLKIRHEARRETLVNPLCSNGKVGIGIFKERAARAKKQLLDIEREYNASSDASEGVQLNPIQAKYFADVIAKVDDDHIQNLGCISPVWKQVVEAQRDHVERCGGDAKKLQGVRWSPLLIKWCITVLNASGKSGYEQVRKALHLPGIRTLQRHIRSSESQPGIYTSHMKKLQESAKHLKGHEREMVLMADEIHIKCGLVWRVRKTDDGDGDGIRELLGFADDFDKFLNGTTSTSPPLQAKKILQYYISSVTAAWSYPVAWYPLHTSSAYRLWHTFWDAVRNLDMLHIYVVAFVCDGAGDNRKLTKMAVHGVEKWESNERGQMEPIFETLPREDEFVRAYTMYQQRKIFFISDPPHGIKKWRNALYNSGISPSRQLKHLASSGSSPDSRMLDLKWAHLTELWEEYKTARDKGEVGMNIWNKKWCERHFRLDSYAKMNVRLAAQVFGRDMVLVLDDVIEKEKQRGTVHRYAATRDFVHHAGELFRLLNNSRFTSAKEGMVEGVSVHNPLEKMREHVRYFKTQPLEHKDFWLHKKTLFDIEMMVEGVAGFVEDFFSRHRPADGLFIKGRRLNQDMLENYFGRIRAMGKGGENGNPNEAQYAARVARERAGRDAHVDLANIVLKSNVRV